MSAVAPPRADELDVLARLRERMLGHSEQTRIVGRYRIAHPNAATSTFARAREELTAAREAGQHGLRIWAAAQR